MLKLISCMTCYDREESLKYHENEVYCEKCGEQMTKITKSKKQYCSECGKAFYKFSIECPKRKTFWSRLADQYHDSRDFRIELVK